MHITCEWRTIILSPHSKPFCCLLLQLHEPSEVQMKSKMDPSHPKTHITQFESNEELASSLPVEQMMPDLLNKVKRQKVAIRFLYTHLTLWIQKTRSVARNMIKSNIEMIK